MLTIAEMLDANNREVRQRRFWRRVDQLLARAIIAATAAAIASTMLALIAG